MAFALDRSLAMREYFRHDEQKLNNSEYVAQSVRQLTIAMTGDKKNKGYTDYRFGNQFSFKKWGEDKKAIDEVDENGVPWWANDSKYDEWVKSMWAD